MQTKIIIAGTHSGVGKTSVALSIMQGFRGMGIKVRAFKVGPDYIDPSYHAVATGLPSHNLDDWMMGKEQVCALFQKETVGCDIAVIEGVMGLFDGFSNTSDEGGTANIAKILQAPVILVVDAGRMARSVAAVIKGYQTLDSDIHICGVILNRVASQGHLDMLKESVQFYNQIPVLGVIFKDETIFIPERHLGLTTASENDDLKTCLNELKKYTTTEDDNDSTQINLNKILKIAQESKNNFFFKSDAISPQRTLKKSVRIAYAKDKAFQFYYQANLDFLESCGATLIPFSPLNDTQLPEDIGALYFGGGFPEVYAKEIEENVSMRESVQNLIKQGIPTYAECGGLIYLAESVKVLSGEVYNMAGIISGQIEMTEKLVHFGYCENQILKKCFLGDAGDSFRGHEFHYSRWSDEGTHSIHEVKKKRRRSQRLEGYCSNNVLASYVHCHFLSYPKRAHMLIQRARDYMKRANKK